MSRSYGRFTTSIWRDEDFTSLTLEQQAVYFTLGLQPDVSAAGTLPYTSRRWAKLSAGTTRDKVEELIEALADHAGQHLVIDEDTEELLIRKFIKWDMGWANSKRLPVVTEAVRAISSSTIRDIAVDELRKIALSDRASPEQRKAVSDAVSAFDRVVVTEGEYIPQPLTAILRREPSPPDASAGPLSPFCSKHPTGTEQPCRDCATARTAYSLDAQQRMETEITARRAAAEAKAACDMCDDKGIRIHPATKLPAGRCNHQPLEAVSA